jgi:hypothetical protein
MGPKWVESVGDPAVPVFTPAGFVHPPKYFYA